MTIVYFTNFINHHQANVADELYRLTEGNYTFVELCPIYDWLLKSGYPDLSSRPYVLQAWKSEDNHKKAMELLYSCDVAMFSCPESLTYEVLRAKTGKLTFDVGERWLKRGWINLASPRLLRFFWHYYTTFAHENVYKLCSGAFVCNDHYKLHSFKDKCFKWGYFTKVDKGLDVEASKVDVSTSGTLHKLMWCARFLKLKHPEFPVRMAARLKAQGYQFVLDMYGSGVELDKTMALAERIGVSDVINFKGNLPNDEILTAMQEHEIFLFTSDKNEGWGAVTNEAMSKGCAFVGSNKIGAVPFLVKDGFNGSIFRSGDLDSLVEKVEFLLDNPERRKKIALNGYITMRDVWSPANAASQFLKLVEAIQTNNEKLIPQSGPCSKAYPV